MADASRIEADLSGAVINGQVAIGEHIVQIHAEHGAVVNYAAPQQRPVPRLRLGRVHRLPRDFPLLVGREHELSVASVQTASGASVEFFGPEGIGKTALLRRLAHRLSGEAPGAVLYSWCGRQPIADVQQFIFECLYDCDSQVVLTPATFATYLQDQRMLVVLDDVELERSELERLMDTLPSGVFVCASQARRLWGEGHAIELPGLGADAAVALIERELGRTLDAGERATAQRLSATLHGHPLSILQAVAQLGASPLPAAGPAPIAASAGGPLLVALAALPGVPVPTADLAAVTGVADAARELEALERRHLVQAHSPRYSLTAETPALITDDDAMRWRQRMLAHFVSAGGVPHDERERASRAEWTAPPILALLAWADATRRPADVLALARVADGMLALGGRWGAWGVALEHALRAARSLGDQRSEAWALHQLGSRALCLEDPAAATASLTSALELRERLGDEPGAALTRHNLELLEGGTPAPPSNGRGGPRPPFLTLMIVLAIAILGATVTVALPGNDDPAPVSPPPGSTSPPRPDPITRPDPGSRTDPGRTRPRRTAPGPTDPRRTDPGTVDPGTVDPETVDPGTVDPGTVDPGTVDPGTVDPGTVDPGTVDPGTVDPGTVDPGTTQTTPTESRRTNPCATGSTPCL